MRAMIGFGAAASSFGFTGGAAQAELLPNSCKVYEVGHDVSLASEDALDIAGFPNIVVDGAISSKTEQAAVYAAQVTLKEVGALDENVKICGYAGDATRKAAEFVVNADGESDAGSEDTNEEKSKITLEDCSRYDEYTNESIVLVQNALGAYPDGIFGVATCRELIDFQEMNGISPLGALGPKTAAKLGVTLVESMSVTGEFNPLKECPKASSCDIVADLALQKLFVKDSKGKVIWEIPLQSGKIGKETRTGSAKLGPVEYGPNKNPERASVDYPEAILVNPRGFGNGGQKIHGSYSFNPNAVNKPTVGSAGCIRVSNHNSFLIAQMQTGTDIVVKGAKPGTTQKYFK